MRVSALGAIAPGKFADLVFLDADPLANTDNARKIHAVPKAGKPSFRAASSIP